MNKAILMGYVGADPKIRYVETRPVASFSMPDGSQLPDRTEWHNIVMWDANAEFAEKYIRKGSRLLIEGKIRTRFWEDRNTIKHTITEIYVDSFDLLK